MQREARARALERNIPIGTEKHLDQVTLSHPGTPPLAVAVPQSLAPLRIGYAEGSDYLNGSVENVGIYNQALTASQIAALSSVPEPSSLILFGLACAMGTAAAAWR